MLTKVLSPARIMATKVNTCLKKLPWAVGSSNIPMFAQINYLETRQEISIISMCWASPSSGGLLLTCLIAKHFDVEYIIFL